MLIAAAAAMVIFGLFYFLKKENGGRIPLLFKALATFMPVLAALAYAVISGEKAAFWIFAGIVCYMIADVLLEIWFISGAAAFGAGHICVAAGLFMRGGAAWYSAAGFAVFYSVMLLVFWRYLGKLGSLLIPGLLYAALLCLMAGLAVGAAIKEQSIYAALAATGGICFVISDTILGRTHLGGKPKRSYSALLLILYYTAVYLLAVGQYVLL